MEKPTCKLCSSIAVDNGQGYCKKHFLEIKEEEYLDNTDPNNLGIIKWARDMLPHYLPQSSPWFHLKILVLILTLYDPFFKNKMERLLNLVSWRGSAKSTLATMILPSYLLVHNGKIMKIRREKEIIECRINERFICIVSETGDMAEDFVVRIRDEFLTNRVFRYFYGGTIEDAIDDRTGQLTKSAFKYNGCFVLGIGSKMQMRGRIKGAYRVTLLLADDIYSEKSVTTEESRKKIRDWWNAAVKNSIDDVMGKIACMGTILHEDTVNVDQIRNNLWKTIQIPLMPLDKFSRFLDTHMELNQSSGECILPFSDVTNEYDQVRLRREHFDKIQKSYDWKLSWPERKSLYMIALEVADAVRNRKLSLFYQEFFHEIVPNSNKSFRKEFFQTLPDYSLTHQGSQVWLYCRDLYIDPMPIYIYVGVDTASGSIDGDDAAITIGGVLPDNRRIVFKTVYGKYGARDETRFNTSRDIRYGKVIGDRMQVQKIGYIDEAFRLAQYFNAKQINVGYAGNEKTIVTEFQTIFRINNSRAMVVGRRQMQQEGAKQERIRNTLLSHYSTYSVWHTKGNGKLEHQLEYLGSSKDDDVADSLEVCFNDVQIPHHQKYYPSGDETNDPLMSSARVEAANFFSDLSRELTRRNN